MALTEFALIDQFFKQQTVQRDDVILGIGDDCALSTVPQDQQLAMTTDTLNEGVHFPKTASAEQIAYKALAVNLSDLAAMGAEPAWISLALTMPQVDETWLKEFWHGFSILLQQYQLQLITGDTTRGPLSITIGAYGFVPKNKALKRSGAQVGDKIYVTGHLGLAALAIAAYENKITITDLERNQLLNLLHHPEPRIAVGIMLRDLAHSAIDISDGLAADLQHILTVSGVGAKINIDLLPVAEKLNTVLAKQDAIIMALTGGDDYELCFTTAPSNEPALHAAMAKLNLNASCIGEIIAKPGLVLLDHAGKNFQLSNSSGYEHFK